MIEYELTPCKVCHEDLAYMEEEGGWCVYVICPHCGTQTAFCRFDKGESRAEAEKRAADLWNMGKVIAERRGE